MADDITPQTLHELPIEPDVQVRDAAKRELDVRLVRWNTPVDTLQGRELFEPGAFAGTDPGKVLLMGPSHEARIGLGQGGQAQFIRVPAGKGLAIDERPDAAYATFRVSKTQAGDEILALAEDGIVAGVSIEFSELPGGTQVESRAGRRTKVHRRVLLTGLSTTHRPAYQDAAVLAVRSEDEGEPVSEAIEQVPEPKPAEADLRILEAVEAFNARTAEASEKVSERLIARMEAFEERYRSEISIPSPVTPDKPKPSAGDWMKYAVTLLSGERVAESMNRELAETVTTDNVGVVPPTYSQELVGIIDPSRPFMNSTRRLPIPETGMQLILPRIALRPTVGIQAAEKDELTSTETQIDTVSFDAVTKGGAGDLSLQILKRSSPSFLTLYLQLLAEAYAQDSEHEALEAMVDLVGDYGGVASGGALDPDNLSLGSAWSTGFSAIRRPPDTMWLSSAAVAAFIDAKADGTNAPLYSNLQANFTAGGGVGGTISGLRVVHTPALDDQSYDVLVGPSTGFAWAEEGTFTLQVDVPAKAGRDVAIVGILWFCPIYPSAFTAYTIAS